MAPPSLRWVNHSGCCRFALFLAAIGYPTDAFAYIDPGVGSIAYQTVLAALLGLGIFFRRVRVQLRALWRRRVDRTQATPEAKRDPRAD